jgi:hypothetical protein
MLQDEQREWKFDDLEAGEVMIFVSLVCVRSHCPDMDVREFARQQLRKPFWDRQKGMGGYVEEQ